MTWKTLKPPGLRTPPGSCNSAKRSPETRSMFRFMLVACTLLCLGVTPRAHAAFPDRPVHIVVPFAPGGGVDVTGACWRNAGRGAWPDRAGGEPSGRRRQYRRGLRRAGAARRLHAADGVAHHRDQRQPVPAPAIQPGERISCPSRWCNKASWCWRSPPTASSTACRTSSPRRRRSRGSSATARPASAAWSISRANCSSSWPGIDVLHVPYKGTGQAINDTLSAARCSSCSAAPPACCN